MQAPARVLVTGFEPFGGESINPSWLAARTLEGEEIAGARIIARELPCVFGDAIDALDGAIRELDPVLVICTGQAGGRAAITLERVAINVDDASIADNAGKQPIDEPIAIEGPVGHWSSLPIKAVVRALREARIRADVSQTAGTFVCNHVFYGLMQTLASRPGVRGGFVHVPFLPEQAARAAVAPGAPPPPSMTLDEITRALRIIVATSLAVTEDTKAAGGATH